VKEDFGSVKILAINGSPRRRGNTDALLAAFLKGAPLDAGIEVVRVADRTIHPCIGCGGCDNTGRCVLEDDITGLYDKILSAHRIILASPIYFYGITAQAKAFVDRTQALWNRQRLEGKKQLRATKGKGFFLSVAASHGEKLFDGAILTARYAFDAMGVTYEGEFLVRGVEKKGDLGANRATLAQAEEAGRSFLAADEQYR